MKQTTKITTKNWEFLSEVWTARPKLELKPRYTYRKWFKKFIFVESVFDVSFEKFILANKYKHDKTISMFISILSNYSTKEISQLPIFITVPLFDKYCKEWEIIYNQFEEYSNFYNETKKSFYDMKEFGFSNIAHRLAGGNRQQAKEFILKQSMAYILAEFRREMKLAENERKDLEKMSEKNTK